MIIPLVTVIIPVYNASKYLEKCLNSILKQTLDNIEIIIVNDNSPDPLDEIICRRFEENDSRVVYIKHAQNLGSGGARNTGIKMAKANYIGFVDCDDYIHPKMFQISHEEALTNDRDIVIFSYDFVDENSNLISRHVFNGDTQGDLLRNFLDDKNTVNPCLWNKLWRKSLFHNNHIELIINNHIDDIIVIPQLLYYAKNIVFIDSVLYYYLKREGSGIHTSSTNQIDDLFDAFFTLKSFLVSIGKLDEYITSLENRFWRIIRFHINTGLAGCNGAEKMALISYLGEKAISENIHGVRDYFPHRYY